MWSPKGLGSGITSAVCLSPYPCSFRGFPLAHLALRWKEEALSVAAVVPITKLHMTPQEGLVLLMALGQMQSLFMGHLLLSAQLGELLCSTDVHVHLGAAECLTCSWCNALLTFRGVHFFWSLTDSCSALQWTLLFKLCQVHPMY